MARRISIGGSELADTAAEGDGTGTTGAAAEEAGVDVAAAGGGVAVTGVMAAGGKVGLAAASVGAAAAGNLISAAATKGMEAARRESLNKRKFTRAVEHENTALPARISKFHKVHKTVPIKQKALRFITAGLCGKTN